MPHHVVFVAPFFMETTLRFVNGAAELPGVAVSLISQDAADKLPAGLKRKLSAHWRIEDGLDPQQIADATRALAKQLGPPVRILAALEQLQVPLAEVREALKIPGMGVAAAKNFRDKSRMKDVLRAHEIPCARHRLVESLDQAQQFLGQVGFPVVMKPPAGAGGKSTFRVRDAGELQTLIQRYRPHAGQPMLLEEFVRGREFSFDSVFVGGKPIWYSISRYMPAPLEVLDNPWIQWCVMLPRRVDGPEYDGIRAAAIPGLKALGMDTGLSHMEWFQRPDGNVAISEVGARPPGAQFTTLLAYAHDLDFYRAWPRLMVFGEFDPPARNHAVGAAYIRGQGRGRVKAIHGLEEAQRRYGKLVVEARLPRAGQAPSDSYEGDGYVIVRDPRTEVIEDALRHIVQLIRVELG